MAIRKKYYASVSFGKDSLAMLFMLIERGYPLGEVVFYNCGMEFEPIYTTRNKVLGILKNLNISYTELYPKVPFLYTMLEIPIKKKGTDIIDRYGYSWCGGMCRWGTSQKITALKKHTKEGWDYVGIAADEQHRFNKGVRPNRILPLAKWGVTEKEALHYCYGLGFTWEENGYKLYDLLDRVSCWCCWNKNLKELFNMYQFLPHYWEKLKDLQSKTDRPFHRSSGRSIFDLENVFAERLQADPSLRNKPLSVYRQKKGM